MNSHDKKNLYWAYDFKSIEDLTEETRALRRAVQMIKGWRGLFESTGQWDETCKVIEYKQFQFPKFLTALESTLREPPTTFYSDLVPADCTGISLWFKDLMECSHENELAELSTEEIVRIADELEGYTDFSCCHEQLHEIMHFAHAVEEVATNKIRNYSSRLRYLVKIKLQFIKRDMRLSFRNIVRFLFKNMDANDGDYEKLFTTVPYFPSKQFSLINYCDYHVNRYRICKLYIEPD